MTKVTDEMLMALADGELDPETADGLMRLVDGDPALRARLDEFRQTRAIAKEAFAGVLTEEVPDRLVGSVRGQSARSRTSRVAGRVWRPFAGVLAASAAGILLAVLILGQQETRLMPGDRELFAILESSPSGTARPWRGAEGTAQATATYVVADGVCRAFAASADGDAWRGVACRRQDIWRVEIAVSDRAPGGDVFLPASDRATQVIDAFLDGVGADEALDAAAEAQLMRDGWTVDRPGAE